MTLLNAVHITKRFDGLTALKAVDLQVKAGEFAAVIGPNGAGKSTLFNCLTGQLTPDEGTIHYNDEDLRGVPPAQRSLLGIGRTFQRIQLFGGMTVRDQLLVAIRAHKHHGALWNDLLRGGHLTSAEKETTDSTLDRLGIGSIADSPVESLTLGMARLVELARALVTQPQLLLLDEPSSGLDRRETAHMAQVLQLVCREESVAVALIEHDVAMVGDLAETVWVLDYGQLIAHGPTQEVFADEKVRAAYLGLQVR